MQARAADPRGAARFYAELFGWSTDGPDHRVARARGQTVAGFGPAGPHAASAWITWMRVASAAAVVAAAPLAGGELLAAAPGRALIADPAGALFGVSENDGAELVNEPGSWDLSTLRTPDPEGAEAFYGALLGWRAEPFGPITLWRLQGYVGGLAEQPVPRDTVAIMTALDGARAHWSVDFRVRDADASAERAARLGATIADPPHDTPGFRTAGLEDPQGAAFSISQFLA